MDAPLEKPTGAPLEKPTGAPLETSVAKTLNVENEPGPGNSVPTEVPSVVPALEPGSGTSVRKLPLLIPMGPKTPIDTTDLVRSSMEPVVATELWSVTNALAFLILLVILAITGIFGISSFGSIQHIKDDWANQRCSPLIMPFASLFGYNTKDNFEFCMGKIFNMHSAPQMDSITAIFGTFTTLLGSIFNSINSMRNTIASLGGGINVVFQEFTDRITMFFYTLRMSAIRLKMLFGRIYATLFSVMYMGMSGITGMSSFTNTFLFSFLDTFCFPGSTEVIVVTREKLQKVPIRHVKIGDILMPGRCTVTATFAFYARGQPMVRLGTTIVSTNHYLKHQGKYIKAGDHPLAIPMGGWESDEYLYCLNTNNHIIPVGILDFLDYDETSEADSITMRMIEERINGVPSPSTPYRFVESGFALHENARICVKSGVLPIKNVRIGDVLSTGSQVVGVIRKCVTEVCMVNGIRITPSTLFWDGYMWVRFGERYEIHAADTEMISLIVTPNSQIELENGLYVRDYMELCSPDAELYYSMQIEKNMA